jgi:hypothetical protein
VTFDSKPLGIKLGPVAEDPGALQRYSEWIRHHWQNPMEDGLRRDIEGARRSSVQVVTLFKRITYKLVVKFAFKKRDCQVIKPRPRPSSSQSDDEGGDDDGDARGGGGKKAPGFIQRGDLLLAVNGQAMKGQTLGQVFDRWVSCGNL